MAMDYLHPVQFLFPLVLYIVQAGDKFIELLV